MSKIKETREEREARAALERRVHEIGRTIASQLPPGVGFTLLLFTYGNNGALAYLSSADRADVTKVMKEFIARHDKGIA
jgi:hypothetical protein